MCEFQADCHRLAEESDDLSLLRGLSEKEIEKQRNRGVTTVTQFAYTYRPGRRGKRKTGNARKHDVALQAVAIRDKKVYVLDSPTVPSSRVALYLDIEGIPDRGYDYLIGLVAVVDDITTTHSFWADDRTEEKAIWNACSRIINSFEDYTLYHYGQYELQFLNRMRRLADEKEAAAIDLIRARSCNVLASIYSHIYFPTRSNGLKDIGPLLGASWTAVNASGIQSLAWRLAWESSGDETLKQHLIRYNLDDCLALRRVTEFVRSVCEDGVSKTKGSEPEVASATGRSCSCRQSFWQDQIFLLGTGLYQQVRVLQLPAGEDLRPYLSGSAKEPSAKGASEEEKHQSEPRGDVPQPESLPEVRRYGSQKSLQKACSKGRERPEIHSLRR